MDNSIDPWTLIVRQAAGQLSAAERERLAAWAREDPERERQASHAQKLVALTRAADAERHAGAAWQRLERRVTAAATEAKVFPLPQPHAAQPAPRRAERLWSRSASRPHRLWKYAAAAGVALAAGLAAWGVPELSRGGEHSVPREIVTRRGERLDVQLPDGSRAMLGPASRLTLVSDGFAKNRRLTLEGEGYFTVAHDPNHPFAVTALGTTAQAVGTAFAVRAYPEEETVRVAVTDGKVLLHVSGETPASALLAVDQVGIRDATGKIMVERDVDLTPYLSWMMGDIVFDRVPLTTVLHELGRMYDLVITLDDSALAHIPVTANFRQTTPSGAVRALGDLLDVQPVRESEGHWRLVSNMAR